MMIRLAILSLSLSLLSVYLALRIASNSLSTYVYISIFLPDECENAPTRILELMLNCDIILAPKHEIIVNRTQNHTFRLNQIWCSVECA